MELNITVIAGTDRPKRQSIHAARLVEEVGRGIDGVNVTFVDVTDFDIEVDGNDPENKIPEYTEIVKNSDGFFIVSPEYNHSFPGSLKTLLDKELKEYIHKPVALAGVSSSMFGGARAIEALVVVVRELGLTVTFTDAHFPKVQNMFDDDGNLLDEAQTERVRRAWDELVWMSKTMKWGRENLPEA